MDVGTAWWEETLALAPKWKTDLVFVDANARVGCQLVEGIGVGAQGFPQDMGRGGSLLMDYLAWSGADASTALIPSSSGCYTWAAHNGAPHR
eukprot:8415500-Pyramimonas_sp.AAC.1